MDNHSKDIRSYNMTKIRSTGTKPEDMVRKFLFSKGLRYRKNVKTLPGKPDIVLPKYKTIVFVNGCFWQITLSDLGQNVLVVWECELKKDKRQNTLEYLLQHFEKC